MLLQLAVLLVELTALFHQLAALFHQLQPSSLELATLFHQLTALLGQRQVGGFQLGQASLQGQARLALLPEVFQQGIGAPFQGIQQAY